MTAGLPGVAAADGPLAGTSWPVILAGRRGRLLIGMSLTELVVAVQLLIVITVMPAVVRQLGGIRLYGLALSVAAIAGIGAAPLAVRLLDAPHRLLATGGALILAGIGGTAIGLLPGAWRRRTWPGRSAGSGWGWPTPARGWP